MVALFAVLVAQRMTETPAAGMPPSPDSGPGAVGRRLEVDVDPARDALGPRAAALAEHHEGDVEAVREASMPSVVSQSVGASAQPSTPISWAWPAQATRLLGRAPRWSWVSDAQPSWGVTDAALVRVSPQC